MKKLIIIFITLAILLTACSPKQTQEIKEIDVIQECINLCKQQTIDLSNGPCLSNQIIEDWVCDVAHFPRRDVDNIAENQCQAFREGKARHFVEVNPDCEFIKKY